MRLHNSRVGQIKREIIDTLLAKELVEIEADARNEVELDVESVLKEYIRTDRKLTDDAKDLASQRGLDYTQHQKIKKQMAEKQRFGIHDEAVAYLANQLIETLLHTGHVSEVFAEDHELRAAIAPVLKRHMSANDPLDEEVRKQIKNLQEGTQDWEIRYQQQMERIRRLKGLD